jgi:dihydrodipicolinate synthase/N-acetylneuraminate lyase
VDRRLGARRPADAGEADPLRDPGRGVLSAARAGASRGLRGLRERLARGLVIPAHPLALTLGRRLDERRQRALSRYYLAAGAGGLAVGVHTTQFAIRDPAVGLYRPVLELAAETAREAEERPVLVAGISGPTPQAVAEAETAAGLGYDAGLLSLGALREADDAELLRHCAAVGGVIPLFGFYLQPAAGGRLLGAGFWRRLVELDEVVAIKVAPFDRYRTLDVVRAVLEGGREQEIALYTGNDDAILADLVSDYRLDGRSAHFTGGLLGQWAVGTRSAVRLLEDVKRWRADGRIPLEATALGNELTDTNAALFDVANGFAGSIAGIHEVLRRQGLLAGRWCLDPGEDLSPGQLEEIDRVYAAYPHLHDEEFVAERLDEWLG